MPFLADQKDFSNGALVFVRKLNERTTSDSARTQERILVMSDSTEDLLVKIGQQTETLLLELQRLQAENTRLQELIDSHNSILDITCMNMKGIGKCDAYNTRGRNCPDCPMEYKIELQESGDAES